MFNKSTEESEIKGVETLIGPSVKVEGEFVGRGNVVVEGIVIGSLKTDGGLQVGSQAKINANIEAKEAISGGEINGNLKIKGFLELTAQAKIFGDIECTNLSIAKGAIFNGKCQMSTGTNLEKKA
jgi:cytoskeletal protein CcmA (bactofilin family)